LGGASWLYLITGGNTFFVSAAEAFIFISGLVVGMVYGGIALKQGLGAAQIKALEGDKKTIEKIAREKYNMARPGETVYRVKKEDGGSRQ
ncbi:MAG: septum formation initiator family protein, partial [Ignavibacteriales bacterium]|nr:septum formation initiator family protein [Ignavibacteriales bacterium]